MKVIKNSVGKSGKALLLSFGVLFCLFALIGVIFGNDDAESTKAENSTISTTVHTTKEITESTTLPETSTENVTENTTVAVAHVTKTNKSSESAKTQEKPKSSAQKTQEVQATVYYTDNGKCYHNENPCGNGTYHPISLEEAQNRGLKPCKKCVLH